MVRLGRLDTRNADAIVNHYCSNDLAENGDYCLHGGRLYRLSRDRFAATLSLANAGYASLVSLSAFL
ncbi:MAG: hypothetical protein JRG86_16190 [Deltaproteobacteria bacterium]|jgi:hypothetical protein|nr:hypothetical protein [Deltaproteobacteria bacterium]MBW2496047.1 hypothetical protein [Deltaproteobacteria bacterium]